MPRYKFTDPETQKTIILTGNSPPSEEELNQAFSIAGGNEPMSFGGFASNVGKEIGQIPEMVGGAATLIRAASPLPTGMSPQERGRVLKGVGKSLYEAVPHTRIEDGEARFDPGDIYRRGKEIVTHPVKSFYDKPLTTALDVGAVASPALKATRFGKAATVGQWIAPRAAVGVAKPGPIKRALAGGLEKVTGIPSEAAINVYNKPLSLLKAPTQKKVASAYAKAEFQNIPSSVEDIISKGSISTKGFIKRGTNAIKEFIEKGTEKAKDIFEARQALDKEIALLENQKKLAKGGSKATLVNAIEAKNKLRQTFNLALDKMAPKLREADRMASSRFKVAPFRDLSLPGNINLFSPKGILRAVPGAPTAIGAGVAALGTGAKVLKGTAQIPKIIGTKGYQAGRAVNVAGKPLTEEEAREYMRKAGGDKEKARKLARMDGRRF
ncbi:MAG TPA: hypothetical protein VMW34_06455 [Anaerolineales bacterium]|nr:hypothetical protein [Anaerolineales bacterium]